MHIRGRTASERREPSRCGTLPAWRPRPDDGPNDREKAARIVDAMRSSVAVPGVAMRMLAEAGQDFGPTVRAGVRAVRALMD